MASEMYPYEEASHFSVASRRLREIAEILGVPVETLQTSDSPLLLHASEDGTRWHLAFNAHGEAVVQQFLDKNTDNRDDDLRILEFLIRYAGSPQQRALVSLIECLLTAHLHK